MNNLEVSIEEWTVILPTCALKGVANPTIAGVASRAKNDWLDPICASAILLAVFTLETAARLVFNHGIPDGSQKKNSNIDHRRRRRISSDSNATKRSHPVTLIHGPGSNVGRRT